MRSCGSSRPHTRVSDEFAKSASPRLTTPEATRILSLSLSPQVPLKPQSQRAAAEFVIRTLREAGHVALLAGGCVRDLLLGRTPTDYDVATDARPEQVRRLFRRVVEVGVAFGVLRVRHGEHDVEVATFRTDLSYQDGRRPSAVVYTDARTDAQRRDFTINGLFLDPTAPDGEQILDYVGGRADLAARIIRAIGNPEDRFAEDRLRMLRAVRFAVVLDFKIESGTLSAVAQHAREITIVSGERIREELSKTLGHPRRLVGLRLLWDTGLAAAVLPEWVRQYAADPAQLGPFPQAFAEAVAALPVTSSWVLVLALLLRGGPADFPDAACASYGQLSSRLPRLTQSAVEVCQRLACTREERHRVEALVRGQWEIAFADRLDLSGKKRLMARPEFPDLVSLHTALLAERPELRRTGLPNDGSAILALWRTLSPEQIRPAPLLTGADVLALGIPPSPYVGRLLEAAYDAQLRGDLSERSEALEWLRAVARGAEGPVP